MTPVKRVRRTPEEARRVILDAAEQVIARTGPAGLRLQEVAEAVGISHPTILHHFESREGLILALNRRTVSALRDALLGAMQGAGDASGDAVSLTFEAWRGGLAQRIAWLMLSPAISLPENTPVFEELVDTLHALRLRLAAPGVAVDRYDSRAIVHLTTVAALGDALAGSRLRQGAGDLDETAARRRFELWFSALLGRWPIRPRPEARSR
jgi:AcrR family transcriptional regulator